MQTVNVTLDNVSPLIEYSPAGAWTDGNTLDPFWQSYDNNGTFTLTTVYGASASLTFNGTAVWIYGAKRANHGPYNVTLDGRVFTDDGFRDGDLFQQVLFAAVDLDPTKPHTMSITNSLADAKRPYLDIDSIVYQVEVPNDYQEVKQQDTVSAFQYSSSGWNTNPENLETYDGSSGHSTSLGDASVVYTFEVRSHVELYGAVGPSGGLYTVQLDNGVSRTFNASRGKFSPRTLLYQDSWPTPGNHILRISNSPFSAQTLGIDYAVVWEPSSTSGDSSLPSSSLSGGAIGGIVAGACGIVIIILVGLFFWYRRRHRRSTIHPRDVLQAEFDFGSDEGNASTADSSTYLSPFPHTTRTRYLPPIPPLPPSSTSYDSPGRSDHSFSQVPYRSESGHSSGSRLAVQNANKVLGGSVSSFEITDEKKRLAMREREGRVQDSGPITFVSGNNNGGMLPPEYRQAAFPAENH